MEGMGISSLSKVGKIAGEVLASRAKRNSIKIGEF